MDTKAANREMEAAGVKVSPNPNGGFDATGLELVDQCWAATEEQCWAMAWGYFSAANKR